ncbi:MULTISPECIES: hypothetical protein [unclassified Streptomyces]|uniref:Uncharacterized protein n=1 Tax=Streptomyces sp. NBC_00060 TaxID=2975636 RepID=A0AAU2H5B5_9ACTN
MIRPETVHVVRYGPVGTPAAVQLWCDLATLVELTPEQARSLTYELGDELGLAVSPRGSSWEVAT